jgi:hypothetical protein
MNNRRTFRIALMLAAIFAAGGFCGWWIGQNSAENEPMPLRGRRGPMQQKEFILDEFTRELRLTDEQSTRISRIMDDWAQEIQKANVDQLRAKQAVFERYSPLVRTNLTADQQKTFDRMTEQMERRRRRMMQNQ